MLQNHQPIFINTVFHCNLVNSLSEVQSLKCVDIYSNKNRYKYSSVCKSHNYRNGKTYEWKYINNDRDIGWEEIGIV